jgi:ribosomal protein S18 acetylase RimI-like enzyme
MAVQALRGGAALPAALLAHQDTRYGVPLTSMFAPSPRTGYYGLHPVAALFFYQTGKEGIPTFGVMLALLALLGLVVAWRQPATRLFGLAWLACAVLALGSVLRIGNHRFVPLAVTTHYVKMSALLPYTWLIHVPGLSGLREPDRFMLLGLLPAALLAGLGVEWLLRRSPMLLAVALTLAVLEAGYSGSPLVKTMATAIPRLTAPIAADRSGSIVVDIPFGLGGGLGAYGGQVSPHALVQATADGHPRAVSDTSWEPASTVREIKAHPFYRDLVAVQYGQAGELTTAQVRAARQDALRMGVRWAITWKPATAGPAIGYLQRLGFTFVRRVHHAELFRLAPATGGRTGSAG